MSSKKARIRGEHHIVQRFAAKYRKRRKKTLFFKKEEGKYFFAIAANFKNNFNQNRRNGDMNKKSRIYTEIILETQRWIYFGTTGILLFEKRRRKPYNISRTGLSFADRGYKENQVL